MEICWKPKARATVVTYARSPLRDVTDGMTVTTWFYELG